MPSFFSTSIIRSIGVDIGDYSIKMVDISRSEDRIVLNNYAEVLLSTYSVSDNNNIVKLGNIELKKAFDDCYMAMKTNCKDFVISISMSKCKIIYLKLPIHAKVLLDNIVPIEAKKYYNLSLSDFTITYNIIEEDANYIGISVLAVNNTEIERLKFLISNYEDVTYKLEPTIFGLLRNINSVSNVGFDVAIDFGASLTGISYIVSGKIYGTDIVSQGSNLALVKIRESLLINNAEANKLFYATSITENKSIANEIITRTYQHICEEVIHMINNFGIKYNLKCSNIYISGGGAKVNDGDKYFKEIFSPYNVKMINSFDRLYITEVLRGELNKSSPTFNNSVGLALSNFV